MALWLQYNEPEDTRWAVWKMEETVDELFLLLPDEELRSAYAQEAQHFVSEKRKKEWLSVRALLHTVWGKDFRIGYSAEGKPYLINQSAYVSISHTQGYAAVSVHPHTPVGIDIEAYGQRVRRVADRFMRPDERVEPYRGDDVWSLLLHWSAKEAVYKCMERPDADFHKLRLEHFLLQEAGQFQVQEYVTGKQQLFHVDYRIYPEFVLTSGRLNVEGKTAL